MNETSPTNPALTTGSTEPAAFRKDTVGTDAGAWQDISTAPENVEVLTKIDDAAHGERNVQNLVRRGRLWFSPDLSMYVYYAPTHWRSA